MRLCAWSAIYSDWNFWCLGEGLLVPKLSSGWVGEILKSAFSLKFDADFDNSSRVSVAGLWQFLEGAVLTQVCRWDLW